jgi:hypothetical protein
MQVLIRIFGPPHELLHVIALLLIGRKPTRITRTHVDIPDNLTTGQFVFVAGFPVMVFGGTALLGVIGLVNAATLEQAELALVATVLGGLGASGTVNDIEQIALRLQKRQN